MPSLDVDDLDLYLVADLKEVAGIVHKAPVDLGNMHEALEAFLKLYERAEVHHTRYLALDDVANLVGGDELALLLIIDALLARI